MPQKGRDLGDQGGALEASERTYAEPYGLRIAAARARSNDGEVVGGRRPAILGLQNRESRHLRIYGQRRCDQPRKHETTKQHLLSCFRGFVATHAHSLRCRVASEYSSICAVRSSGYEIVTSVSSPAPFVTASSLGMTKAVYEGNCRWSTRATISP